jgi:hypothetical protein
MGQQICAVCCGTKRLVQIRCPSDCAWLASAREHPPAAVVRQQQRDLGLLAQSMRDFSERQSQLFFLINTFIVSYQPSDLQSLVDDDVAEAADALAATYETASRGVIYEHRPASLPAERLCVQLKPVLAEAGKGGGSAFERDAAVVLRRIGEAARELRAQDTDNAHAYLELLTRVMPKRAAHDASGRDAGGSRDAQPSRLILP